jgi:hypothetical protein
MPRRPRGKPGSWRATGVCEPCEVVVKAEFSHDPGPEPFVYARIKCPVCGKALTVTDR